MSTRLDNYNRSQIGESDAIAARFFGLLLQCHEEGRSENDIRSAFRDFLLRTGIINDEMEVKTEVPPGRESQRSVDMYVRNTYVEFKTNIVSGSGVSADAVAQLDDYLLKANQSGYGIQNGILTDGKRFLKRNVGDHILPLAPSSLFVFDRSEQGHRVREYVHGIIDTDAREIKPSMETLTAHLCIDSDLLKQATALLYTAHLAHRDDPAVAVKRRLWQDLLQVALGQESASDIKRDDWLFIRHTYLITLTALILQRHFGIDVEREAETNPEGLLDGRTLERYTGVKGVIESDLFLWAHAVGETQYVRAIARKVAQFDWTETADELAATLYQNTITQEERKSLGEYYTPRWLAQAIVDELVDDPTETVTLDPSCGSGTFIECLVRKIISAADGLTPSQKLDRLLRNVIGVDTHPVAVQLAKATWVLNCQKVITDARALGNSLPPIVPPIHLGDSLQLRYDRRTLLNHGTITILTSEVSPESGREVQFRVPLSLAQRTEEFDRLMLAVADEVKRDGNPIEVLEDGCDAVGTERKELRETVGLMQELHAHGRDHVWAYYLRNMVRPAVISESKVDVIVGNPPWLTYSNSADIVREELVRLSQRTYGTWAGGKNAANQDVSTLFFARVADLYLREGGRIGMVLPHSTLRSGQHLKWRSGNWVGKENGCEYSVDMDFGVKDPWDLDNLDPNTFFPMPASVVFAQLLGRNTEESNALAPGSVEVWRGKTATSDVTRDVETLLHDDGEFHSPYHNFARRGTDIFDRRLYFISVYPNPVFLALPNTWVTVPRISTQDKKQYDVRRLDRELLHGDSIFNIYLGESIAPYYALPPHKAALPVDKRTMTMPLKDDGSGEVDPRKLERNMERRWETMCQLWDENKGANDKKTLSQNLDWIGKLSSQLAWCVDPGERPIRIAYTTSGEPSAALIEDPKAILDTSLYQVTCRNTDEAHYLLAIINSNTLATAAKPFCPTNWSRKIRTLHKHLWKLPIPEFDRNIALHRRLARLGHDAAAEARELLAPATNPTPRKAREMMRHVWQPSSNVAGRIERAVAELLRGH